MGNTRGIFGGDEMVMAVQQWLNDTFPEYFKYDPNGVESGKYPLKPDGYTGSETMKALVRAVQIHVGATPYDGAWGDGTSSKCPVISETTTDKILIRLLQGGFYCKGYNPGGFDGGFGSKLKNAINNFKDDLGIKQNGQMEPEVFKAVLNTDATVPVSGSSPSIRAVQRYLNGNYYNSFKKKIGYLPTGGLYERKTNKALIHAFQSAINTTADGSIGTNTYLAMPEISPGTSKNDLVYLLQCALICNEYTVVLNGDFNSSTEKKVSEFQKFMCLDQDEMVTLGSVNRRTWSALLQSKGDPDRDANACDCASILDTQKAGIIKDYGYKYVGRYLTGTVLQDGIRVSKALTLGEIEIITRAGLKIFPIYQDGGASSTYFSYDTGYADARKAKAAAESLRIPYGEIIYFAVDYDFTEKQGREIIIPHFAGISQYMEESGNKYKIGIYGSRNICTQVMKANDACSCFVSDMSTGYSGNLGFPMPEDWAFDQFHEFTVLGSGGLKLPLDKVTASGHYKGFDSNSKCGQDHYKDCLLHKMEPFFDLNEDGRYLLYYRCPICGYQVKAPYQQDKDILTEKDYMCIQAGYLLLTYFSDLTKRGILYSNFNVIKTLTLGMQLIRLKYPNKYDYCDANGDCLEETKIVPETSGNPNAPQDGGYISIETALLDGLFSDFAEGIGEILVCFAFPELAPFFALKEVSEVIAHPSKFADDGISFIFKQIAEMAEIEALNVILDLISIGIDLEDDDNINAKINVGDYIVKFTACSLPGVKPCKVVFDKNSKKVKGIAVDYYDAP